MSKKFEQLLDLIVNEEMDKANELFHEIVVEKSRSIYENLIAQEAADEEEMDEAKEEEMDESEEEMDEAKEEEMDESEEEMDESEEEADESVELEDSYMMDGDDDSEPSGLEQTDDLEGDVSADDMGGDMGDDMSGEEQVEFDIRDAIEKLEAALASLEGGEEGGMDDMDDMDDMGDMDADSEMPKEMMGVPAMEGKKRMTREYVEKVGNDWDKSGSMKGQKQHVGAGTGDTEGAPDEGRSPIASGSNKPGPAGVNGKNLVQGATEGQSNTGTSPGKVSKGLAPHSGEKFASGIHNVDGKKSGVKTLSGVKGGHGAEKKGSGPGPVGSGTGDKAGQTSVPVVKQFLKPYSK